MNNLIIIMTLMFLFWSQFASADSQYWTPEQALKTKVIEITNISPSGKYIAYIVSKIVAAQWVSELYIIGIGNHRRVLTVTQSDISMPEWSPDNQAIAYLAPGKKHLALWIVELTTKKPRKLIELNNNIVSIKWSPNGKYIAFVANNPAIENTRVTSRLHLLPLTKAYMVSNEIETLTPVDHNIISGMDFDWLPDSSGIAYVYQADPDQIYPIRTRAAIIKIATKHITNLPDAPEHAVFHPIVSPDGKWLAVGSNIVRQHDSSVFAKNSNANSQICLFSLRNKNDYCLQNTANGNPMPLAWDNTSSKIFALDIAGIEGPEIYTLSTIANDTPRQLTKTNGYIDPATISFNRVHNLISFAYETIQIPPEIILTSSYHYHPILVSHIQTKLPKKLGTVKIIHWLVRDETSIEGLLNFPSDYSGNKKYPLLVAIHGGPTENWSKRYLGGTIHRGKNNAPFCVADFLGSGFIVFQPNPRGSGGYGPSFRSAIVGRIGTIDYQDIMDGIDYLEKSGIVDKNHYALFGWSFGGYLVSWIVTQTKRFKTAVAGAGYTDLISYSGTTDIPKLMVALLGKTFWDDPKIYLQKSPIMFVQNVTTPLLLVHGTLDVRIPIAQSIELYTALKAQGKKVKMLVMPGEGHLPTKPQVIISSMQEIEKWLKSAL